MLKDALNRLLSLDEYNLPPIPNLAVKVNKDEKRTSGTVLGGKEFSRIEYDNDGSFIASNNSTTEHTDGTLDGYDIAYLDKFVPVWAKAESKAKVLKVHWLNAESAVQIEKSHTNSKTKKTEIGYSKRTVSDYIKAFYAADDHRSKDGEQRQRTIL